MSEAMPSALTQRLDRPGADKSVVADRRIINRFSDSARTGLVPWGRAA